MESEGFGVIVVNTNKVKVITMSTKKNDANDAATLAFYLLKEMLPESHLCDQTSEEIRRKMCIRDRDRTSPITGFTMHSRRENISSIFSGLQQKNPYLSA